MSGIPRDLMPQIPKESLPDFLRYVHKHGVKVSRKDLSVNKLLPVQKYVNREKVNKFKDDIDEQGLTLAPIVVTSQGFIVDGHHRWLAVKELGHEDIDCIVCDCPLLKFLKLSHGFGDTYTKSVHELTTYGRWALIVEHTTRLQQLLVRRLDLKLQECFKCTNCGHIEQEEQETQCWKCGAGDMVYQDGIGYKNKFDGSAPSSGYVPGTI
jgi:hypothetical protein